MQRSTTLQKTDTDLDARRVSRRVRGDLLSIHEKFDMLTASEIADLAHDLELGLAADCIRKLTLYLYKKGASAPTRVYRYERVAPGTFASSDHSGRIEKNPALVGGHLEYIVNLRDRPTWETLKSKGLLRIGWSPCESPSIAGMRAKANGGYTSGGLGFSRTRLSREDD